MTITMRTATTTENTAERIILAPDQIMENGNYVPLISSIPDALDELLEGIVVEEPTNIANTYIQRRVEEFLRERIPTPTPEEERYCRDLVYNSAALGVYINQIRNPAPQLPDATEVIYYI